MIRSRDRSAEAQLMGTLAGIDTIGGEVVMAGRLRVERPGSNLASARAVAQDQ